MRLVSQTILFLAFTEKIIVLRKMIAFMKEICKRINWEIFTEKEEVEMEHLRE